MTLSQRVQLLDSRIARLERDRQEALEALRREEEADLDRMSRQEAERDEIRELYSLGMR